MESFKGSSQAEAPPEVQLSSARMPVGAIPNFEGAEGRKNCGSSPPHQVSRGTSMKGESSSDEAQESGEMGSNESEAESAKSSQPQGSSLRTNVSFSPDSSSEEETSSKNSKRSKRDRSKLRKGKWTVRMIAGVRRGCHTSSVCHI